MMKLLSSILFSFALLSVGHCAAEQQQQAHQAKACACKDCKCTLKSHCGCYNNQGCTCSPNGSCCCTQGESGQLLSVNEQNLHHGKEEEHKHNEKRV